RLGAAAVRGVRHAAQGPRDARARARAAHGSQLDARLRRQHASRSRRAAPGAEGNREGEVERTRDLQGRSQRQRGAVAVLPARGHLRPADGVRRLRHGGRRGARARAACRQHADRRHRTACRRRRRHPRGSGGCRRAGCGAAEAHHGQGGVRAAARGRVGEGRDAADVGGAGEADGRGAHDVMSGFSAAWLALREPADTAARSSALASFVAGRPPMGRLLDLGGGTGANVRYLSSRLPTPQFWTIVDNDAALLARAPVHATRRHADLNAAVADEELFAGSSIVTASALLDLVSERWLATLVDRCRAAGAGVLFALSYDGRIACSPEEPEDDEIRRMVNEHQKRDKGFGPALGPDAAARAAQLLSTAGYTTKQE